MAINSKAQANHDLLFPGHRSTLAVTDPELVEVFGNFAFDEVIAHGGIDTLTRMKVILASLVAMQTLSEYRVMLAGALNAGVTPTEVKEIVYQAVPYVGMARAFEFLHATNEILTARGVELPLEGQATSTPETRMERGLAVQKEMFGDRIEAMYAASPADELHFQRFLSANCFGDHVARSGLDRPTRELLTFAMLLSLGGCEPQLKGHIRGNANLGNDRGVLLSVVTQLVPYVGYPRALNALACIDEVLPE